LLGDHTKCGVDDDSLGEVGEACGVVEHLFAGDETVGMAVEAVRVPGAEFKGGQAFQDCFPGSGVGGPVVDADGDDATQPWGFFGGCAVSVGLCIDIERFEVDFSGTEAFGGQVADCCGSDRLDGSSPESSVNGVI